MTSVRQQHFRELTDALGNVSTKELPHPAWLWMQEAAAQIQRLNARVAELEGASVAADTEDTGPEGETNG